MSHRLMYADLGFPLTRDHIRDVPAPVLLGAVRTWLERVSPVCLMHPHGFYVVLLSRNDTEEWRFHFWPKGSRAITGMPAYIHTHDRQVESRVLQGQLTNILYDVDTVSIGGHPLYQVSYQDDRYVATTTNSLRNTHRRAQPLIRNFHTVGRGDTYQIERHSYHESVVSQQLATSTIVCMYERSPGPIMVVGLDGYPETITFTRTEQCARALAEQLSL